MAYLKLKYCSSMCCVATILSSNYMTSTRWIDRTLRSVCKMASEHTAKISLVDLNKDIFLQVKKYLSAYDF